MYILPFYSITFYIICFYLYVKSGSNPIAVRECVMSFVKCYDLVTV